MHKWLTDEGGGLCTKELHEDLTIDAEWIPNAGNFEQTVYPYM